MIRAVLTVIVAVALVGTALPALEANRTSTTVDRLETQGVTLERSIASVAADSVAVDDPTLAAGTTVRVTAPTGVAAARIDRLVIADPADVLTDPPDDIIDPYGDITDPIDVNGSADANEPADTGIPSNSNVPSTQHAPMPDVAIVYWLADGPRLVSIAPTARTATVDVDSPIELRPSGTTHVRIRLVTDDTGPTLTLSREG